MPSRTRWRLWKRFERISYRRSSRQKKFGYQNNLRLSALRDFRRAIFSTFTLSSFEGLDFLTCPVLWVYFIGTFTTFGTFRTFKGSPKENSDSIKRQFFIHFLTRFLIESPLVRPPGSKKCKNMVKIREKWSIPAENGRHNCRVRRVCVGLIHIPPGGDKTPETALYGLIG